MYYVCVENNIVTSILNYVPNVPSAVSVTEISDSDYQAIVDGTKRFDTSTMSVRPLNSQEQAQENLVKLNNDHRTFLNNTDWKVLRHLREKTLGLQTSLTEEEYLELEQQRENAANSIQD